MKFFFKAAMIFIFAVTASVFFAGRAFAQAAEDVPLVDENGYTRFTGEFEPTAFANYYIDDVVKINEEESFSFPKTSILTVRKGGELQIYVGGAVTFEGALIIEQGARVTVSGEFTAYEGSRIECFGEFVTTRKSTVMLAGDFSNNESSAVVFGGKVNLYKSGRYENAGPTTFSNSANAVISGKYDVLKNGKLFVKGTFNTTLNAKVLAEGYIYLSGKIYNTGELTFKEGAVDILNGQFVTGKTGRVFDERIAEPEAAPEASKQDSAGSPKTLRGIDVSYWQGAIDWKRVKASGVDFAFLRTSVSDYYSDETFYYNITEAQRAGIKVGVYHYCKATTVESARTEARFFLEALEPYKLDFPIVLDIEDRTQEALGVDELTRIAAVFCEEIKKAGYTPMIYSSASWLNNRLNMSKLSEYEVWVAHWGTTRPAYRGSYGVWQYSSEGRVSGISGDVDLNIAYIDYSKK